MTRLLLVEDDVMLSQAVVRILESQDYAVDTAKDGDAGFQLGRSGAYDVIILDVMLPRKDGFTVATELRKQGIATPILMLTAKAQISDKIEGLDSGADDYMTKPFSPAELLAHLRALLRRSGGQVVLDAIAYADLSLDIQSHDLSCNGKKINLSFKEYQILEFLMREQGQVVSKSDIITKVWGADADIADNNVEAYISLLRKKLRFLESLTKLDTIRKVGYRLVPQE